MHLQQWRQAYNALSGARGGAKGRWGGLTGCEPRGRRSRHARSRPHKRHAPPQPLAAAAHVARVATACCPRTHAHTSAEAVKHKRDSWQTWENYAVVAVRVQQWQAAVRALAQVLGLSQGQRVDLAVLSALVGQVEAGRGGAAAAAAGSETQQEQAQQPDAALAAEGATPTEPAAAPGESSAELSEQAAALGELATDGGNTLDDPEAVARRDARAHEVLEQSVGQLTRQVAASVSGDSAFWEVYARWVRWELGWGGQAQPCCGLGISGIAQRRPVPHAHPRHPTPPPLQVSDGGRLPRCSQGVPAEARARAGRPGLAGQPRGLRDVCGRVAGAVPRLCTGVWQGGCRS